MASYKFLLVDVFTDKPLSGNQLAVVLHAESLTTEQMQAIALEFNYSETTFILPPNRSEAEWRLRCFSPTSEVFGAGHNALGAWWVLAELGMIKISDPLTLHNQELGDKVLPVGIYSESGKPKRVAMTQSEPWFGDKITDRNKLASALGIDQSDLEVDGLDAQVISTGASHLLVPVKNLAAMSRIRVDVNALVTIAHSVGTQGCYTFCLETGDSKILARTRAFFPGIGISEDPATGSAAGPLGIYLSSKMILRENTWGTFEQGVEIARPSRINVKVHNNVVEVAGSSVIVGEGIISF